MTRQLSDCLLSQLMGSAGGDQIVEKTQKLPYEGQVYINTNINMLREQFHEFVSKHADPENPEPKTITTQDVTQFFSDLNKKRRESLI